MDKYVDGVAKIYSEGASHPKSERYATMEAQVRDSMLWGSPEDVKGQIARWNEAGINHFILMTPRPFDRAMMERFKSDVAPAFG